MTQPLKHILESLLFVAEEPLSVQQLKSILEIGESDDIRSALEELIVEYDQRGGGFELRQIAGGYQFRTRAEYSEWVKKLLKPSPARLSRAALETLAIIAYKQPIIRADVEHIRGVDCGGVLRMLLEKKLIRVMGRKDIPGRPMIYGTTRQFLEVFNLKDLRDLPSPKEIEALGAEIEMAFPDTEEIEVDDAVSESDPGSEQGANRQETIAFPPDGDQAPELMPDERAYDTEPPPNDGKKS
jgi:segregation and condensation protein B